MDDGEARKFALDTAAVFMRGAPYTEILLAARAFHAFLVEEPTISPKGAEALKAHVDEIQSEQSVPPPIPRQDHGQADQSPTWDCSAFMSHEAIHVFDENDTPTRIVRPVA